MRTMSEIRDSMYKDCVIEESGCWVDTKHKAGRRYKVYFNGRTVSSTKMAYLIFNGPIAPGLCAYHTCGNPRCINPEHIVLDKCGSKEYPENRD